jgi:hypothetical protein
MRVWFQLKLVGSDYFKTNKNNNIYLKLRIFGEFDI